MGMTSSKPEWSDFLSYMHVRVAQPHPPFDPPDLVVGTSTLPGMTPEANRGLFAAHFIPAGTLLMSMELEGECLINDGMVNLTPVLAATNDAAMYEALKELHRRYYDTTVAARVNTIMASDAQGTTLYQARIDIPRGGELLRMYGFVTWIFELLPRMTSRTITGFACFVREYGRTMSSSEIYSDRVRALVTVLDTYYQYNGVPCDITASDQIVARCGKQMVSDIMALYVAKIAATRQ